ncbi:hypothetical protein OG470_17865 [Micromonospora sp. NBC_00389]|uniref:hypothetical protein n=1 Tax=Micromonospora sp. NBC_00389 TaxID=2903586 RepID=UPI002E1D4F2A
MPKAPRRPPQLRGRIFRGSVAVSRGLLTRNDLRSAAWRPLFRDVYADSRLRVTHRARCAAVGRWLIPPGAAIAGRAAAALYGCPTPSRAAPVDVLVPKDSRIGPTAGLQVHHGEIDLGDVVERAGVRVTGPARTCWDLARWLDLVEAVVVIDALLARRLTDVSTLREYALARAGQRGWRSLLLAVDLADAGAESPQESRTRVRLVLAGLPRPQTRGSSPTRAGSWPGLTWPGRRSRSRWSTTGSGTTIPSSSTGTVDGSTGCSVASGSCCT